MSDDVKMVWKYRIYMTKDCRLDDFEFDRNDVREYDITPDTLIFKMNNGAEYYISRQHVSHVRISEEKVLPAKSYTGRMGAY